MNFYDLTQKSVESVTETPHTTTYFIHSAHLKLDHLDKSLFYFSHSEWIMVNFFCYVFLISERLKYVKFQWLQCLTEKERQISSLEQRKKKFFFIKSQRIKSMMGEQYLFTDTLLWTFSSVKVSKKRRRRWKTDLSSNSVAILVTWLCFAQKFKSDFMLSCEIFGRIHIFIMTLCHTTILWPNVNNRWLRK